MTISEESDDEVKEGYYITTEDDKYEEYVIVEKPRKNGDYE